MRAGHTPIRMITDLERSPGKMAMIALSLAFSLGC